nr:unnamed protein product [Digitaria exilis]
MSIPTALFIKRRRVRSLLGPSRRWRSSLCHGEEKQRQRLGRPNPSPAPGAGGGGPPCGPDKRPPRRPPPPRPPPSRHPLGARHRDALSRRWAHLPRELDALDLRLADMLPPRYHRWVHLYNDACSKGTLRHAVRLQIVHSIRRYERRAMRAFASSTVTSFLQGPRRNVKELRLDFVVTGNTGCVNALVAEAMDAWGVEDLEVVAKSTFTRRDGIHLFPSHGLCEQPRLSCLRSLKLGGCTLPSLHEYSRLSVLVLKGIPKSTPAAAYEGIFTLCLQLRVFHLISCGCIALTLVADAPNSEIRELVLEDCIFGRLWLRALPCLERLASGCGVVFESSSSFPCLKQWNLTMHLGIEGQGQHLKLELDTFLEWTPDNITDLVLRLAGPYSGLELGEEIEWPPTKLGRHHHLKEFVVAGYEGTTRQVFLAKLVVGACTALQLVAMFKNGYAREDKGGRWGWEMATQQRHLWTSEEKEKVLKQVMDGVPSSTTPVQVVLG